jgi:hypothetical protein
VFDSAHDVVICLQSNYAFPLRQEISFPCYSHIVRTGRADLTTVRNGWYA